MFYMKSQIYTDSGIIFEAMKTELSYSYDNSDYDDSEPLTESLMDFNIFVAYHKAILHRKYLKVQTVLANLGGLLKALFMGMYVISFYFFKTKLNQVVLNKILNFVDENP